MAVHADQVNLLDLHLRELVLHASGEMAGASEHLDAGRVGVEPMRRAELLRRIDVEQQPLQRVAIEPAAGMNRQRRRLVHDDDRFILVEDPHVHVHRGLDDRGQSMQVSLSRLHSMRGSHGLAISLAYSDPWQWETAVASASKAADWVLAHRGRPVVLNVNVPALPPDEIRGTKWAQLDEFGYFRVATADYEEQLLQFEISTGPSGQVEVGGSEAGRNPLTDTALCRAGYVTMTALTAVEPTGWPEVEPEVVIPMPLGGARLRTV